MHAVRSQFAAFFRSLVFNVALVRYRKLIDSGGRPTERLLRILCFGWGNRSFRADTSYLSLAIECASQPGLAILECGSGLSTILVGYAAARTGRRYFSLEHLQSWFDKVAGHLEVLPMGEQVSILLCPLIDLGDYCWYDTRELEVVPVDLVLCDGPPSGTPGGRVGLESLFANCCLEECDILLDDAFRSSEVEAVESWRRKREVSVVSKGTRWVHLRASPVHRGGAPSLT